MVVAYRIHGYVMVVGIAQMLLMNQRIVVHQIEHVRLVFGNAIMVDVSVQINVVMGSTIAGSLNYSWK
jgi:hypothetical protein